MKWTEEEISSLINFYSNYSKEYIMNKIPNRTWNSIVLMAGKLHLKFDSKYRRNSSLEILLNESHVSYYWIGFLMADGHFANRKRLKIWASIKDKIQIDSLANYLNCSSVTESVITNNKLNKKYKIIGFTAQNPNVIQQICDRFDIQSNKTENPPKTKVFKKINDDLLLSLIIGFIDGDGSISIGRNRKSPSLTIKNHSSWLNNLTFFKKHIYSTLQISPMYLKSLTAKLNNNGYAFISITDSLVISKLKQFAIKLNLPILERKWNKVPITYKNRYKNTRKVNTKITL